MTVFLMFLIYYLNLKIMDEDNLKEKENHSFLPQKEMYLYFPKNNDICEKIIDPKLKIIRNIFHAKKYHEEEQKKLENLKLALKEFLDKKSNDKLLNFDILRTIYENKEELLRYLNFNNYDFYQTLILLKMFNELLSKLKINYKKIELTEMINTMLNCGFIYTLGRDKKFRPIIVIDFRKYESKLLKKLESRECLIDLAKMFIFYFNFIIEKMMIPGQIEQFSVILQIDGMDSSNFLNNFKDIIYLIQMCFPSRLHLMYIVSFKNIFESSYNIIENFLLMYNKERTIFINKKKYNSIFDEISNETLREFLDPITKSTLGNNSTRGSNGSNSGFLGGTLSKFKSTFAFPPKLNNNIIFDNEDEKAEYLMNTEDYLKFIKENENSEFYCFKEELFLIRTIDKCQSSKEFSLEHFATFKKSNFTEIIGVSKDLEIKDNKLEKEKH